MDLVGTPSGPGGPVVENRVLEAIGSVRTDEHVVRVVTPSVPKIRLPCAQTVLMAATNVAT